MTTHDIDLNDVLNKNLSVFDTWITESVPKIFEGLVIADFRDVDTVASVVREREFNTLGTRTCEFNPGSISSIGDIVTCSLLSYVVEIERTASGVEVRIASSLPVVLVFYEYIVARTRIEPDDSRLSDSEKLAQKKVDGIKKMAMMDEIDDIFSVYGLFEHYSDLIPTPDDKAVAISVCREVAKSIDTGSVIAVAGSSDDVDGCRLIDVSEIKGSGEEMVIVGVISIICNLQRYSRNNAYAWKVRN